MEILFFPSCKWREKFARETYILVRSEPNDQGETVKPLPVIFCDLMFELFNKKNEKPTVTKEDQEWIEENFSWFIETFGLELFRQKPFLLPTFEEFPYTDLTDAEQFQALFIQVCKRWDLDPNDIVVSFFDDLHSKELTTWIVKENATEPIGLYYRLYTTGEKQFNVQLARSILSNSQLVVSVLAHELAHVKLLGGEYIQHTESMEPLTDLACIYFGFGLFIANTVQTRDAYGFSRTGYLPNQLISYANALLCHITQTPVDTCLSFINANTSDMFKRDYAYLDHVGPVVLTIDAVLKLEDKSRSWMEIDTAFEERRFDDVIKLCRKMLDIDAGHAASFNSIGYALIQKKDYVEAIKSFNDAIGANPYWDYPYNNRGYCKLQLGQLESAFADLQSSFQMNPENSFSWRNLGAYYLVTGEYEKAQMHFEEAQKNMPPRE